MHVYNIVLLFTITVGRLLTHTTYYYS